MKKLIFLFLFVNSCLKAQVYEFNTQSLGQWNGAGESYSDIWGYTANGREYAILGSARFIYFFDVTNPSNIQLVDKFGPYTATSWREFKTYNNFAYAVTDGPDAGGLRIFDLQNLPDTVIQVRQTTAFFSKCHMPFIDEANGRMYCAGTDTRNNGIIVLDLSTTPDNPSLVINQVLPRGYVHDVFVKNNIMYASHIYSGYISQYDCTGGSCTGELSAFQTGGYNHSSWMNADQSLLINAIETAGHPLWLFPIESNGTIGNENYKQFKSVTLKEQYPSLSVGEGSIGHNPYIVGDRAYVSYYTDGVQVYNISDVNNIRRVAYFDTDRGHTSYSPVFRGCWGTFPFFPSGNILAIDIQSGMWIFKTTPCANSQPPSISISSQSSTYPEGSSFTVNATVADSDGTPVKVEFYNGDGLLGTDAESPFEYHVPQAIGNGYSFFAKVYDDCGISTTSSILAISVFSTCNDGIQNGSETGIDCGGSCAACTGGCIANLSQGQPASQSSTYGSAYGASLANDGNSSSFNHTNVELQPWWQVDLGDNNLVTSIQITNRGDCCGNRIKRFRVFVSNTPVSSYSTAGQVYIYDNSSGLANGQIINISNLNNAGRYVRVWMDNTGYVNNPLHLSEVKVMGCSNAVTPCTGNVAPTISLGANSTAFPQGSTSFPWGSSFDLNATVNDPDGSVNSVEFYSGSTLLGTDNSSPFNFTMNSASSNSYTFTAKAIDNCNASTTSGQIAVTTTVTCSDGYQNGTETGVDCGGTCSACNTACPSPVNLSQGKAVTQSSTYGAIYSASKANDGNSSSFNHTNVELQPWWQVDLGDNYLVTSIQITNRGDCCGNRIKRFRVFVSNTPISSYSTAGHVYIYDNSSGLANGQVINISNLNSAGRYVRVWMDNTGYVNNPLHLSEVNVMGCSNAANPCTGNEAPTITLGANSTAFPEGSTSFPMGSSFNLNATVNDPDGSINSVEFYSGSTLLGTDNSSPFSFTMNSATSNSYNFTAKAIDNCNASTTSGQITVTTTVTCSDGYQNGAETGVDCGGTCSACTTTCPTPVNLSQGKVASQSSNYTYSANYPASKANDGTSTSFNHTNVELQPWWQVDLGDNYLVTSIQITNRGDCCGNRIKRFRVFVSNTPISSYSTAGHVYIYDNSSGLSIGQVINISNLNSTGRYVRVWMDNTGYVNNPLHLSEIKVMGCINTGNPCTGNEAPTITLGSNSTAFPQGSTSFPMGSSFNLNATVNDPDGSVNSVEFYSGSTLLGTDNSSPFSFTMNSATSNSYTFTAKAIDNCNAYTTSGQITVTTTVTCSDGYQNGTETGVDCGGTCNACSTTCPSPVNLSEGKAATQSSTYGAIYAAGKANDGISSSFNHTNVELQPWWQVDLGGTNLVTSIQITNRGDCCGNRIKRFRVFVSNTPISSYSTAGHVYIYDNSSGLSIGQVIDIANLNSTGRYVRVWMDNTGYVNNPLHLSEVNVMGCVSNANVYDGNKAPSKSLGASSTTFPLDTLSIPRVIGGALISNLAGNSSFQQFTNQNVDTGLRLFPNPTQDWINLHFDMQSNHEIQARIFDLQGRLLYEKTVVDNKINMDHFAAGSYFIIIRSRSLVKRFKVIKL